MVRSFYPSNSEDAVKLAKRLIADGHTVSLGLTQLNDRNLATFGISIEDAFDPCTNIKHGTQLFAQYYRDALQKFKNIPQALEAALSKYNSGDYYRGKNDGYVDLIYKNAGIKNVHYASEHRNDKKPLVHKEKVFTLGMVNHDSEQ
jgi:type IV secretion system protein VirB1